MDENNSSIEQIKNIGKCEGFACGIIALYSQDCIKKPEEQITHLNLLGASNDKHILELFGNFCDLELDYNVKVRILSKYLQGSKNELIANVIYNRYIKWNEIDDLSDEMDLTKHGFSEKTFIKLTELVQPNSDIQLGDVLSILNTENYDYSDMMQ